jgi:alanine racemase
MPTRPVWAEISLDRLAHNFKLLRRLAAVHSADLLAVVKADAYGHGLQSCGPALAAAGAQWLGVTSVDEGAALRRVLGVLPGHFSATRILGMSSLWHGEADAVLDYGLTPSLWEPYQFALLEQAALRRGVTNVSVHLEIDTGMARQGVAPGPALARVLHRLAGSPLLIEGVMAHFSAPERLDLPDTDTQLARFAAALDQLATAGIHPRLIHAGNSATVFDPHHTAALAALASRVGAQLMLRPGLALYGCPVRFTAAISAEDSEATVRAQTPLQPVLAWKTRITSLRDLSTGDTVGYNSIFRAQQPTRLALAPVGYADGLNRLLSNPVPSPHSAMLVRGCRAPIAGRISMDQTMLDVTAIPGAAIGDEIVILGEQASRFGLRHITAHEHADLCGTIPYEILCNITARVPRGVVD